MRIFSYQNKKRAKTFLLILSIAAALILLFTVYRVILVGRYIRVVDGKVTLDYNQKFERARNTSGYAEQDLDVEILIDEPVTQASSFSDLPLEPLNGNYISTTMFLDMDLVSSALSQLEATPDTMMLDLKSIYGSFYYSSGTKGAVTSSADIGAIDALIQSLASDQEVYLVARIASLSDINYALAHQSYGLPRRDGALWMCENGCYWLDPLEEDVQDYLVSIAKELSALGFDEIIFDDFQIPESQNIQYNHDVTREEAALEAAQAIRDKLSETPIRVSFISTVPTVTDFSDRIYLETEDGASVSTLVESVSEGLDDPSSQIVFITPSRDTRFDGYGILRPLVEQSSD